VKVQFPLVAGADSYLISVKAVCLCGLSCSAKDSSLQERVSLQPR